MFNCRLFNVPCNNLWEIFLANILGLENYDTTSIIPLPKKTKTKTPFSPLTSSAHHIPPPPPLPPFFFPSTHVPTNLPHRPC